MNVWFFIFAFTLGFIAMAFGLNELRQRVMKLERKLERLCSHLVVEDIVE